MPVLEAIVFDFDGTILDTETPDFQTWQEVYRSHGAELPLEVWLQCVGGGSGEFAPDDYLEELLETEVDVVTRGAVDRKPLLRQYIEKDLIRV